MMSGKNGPAQIVKAAAARLTAIPLTCRLGVIAPLLGDLWAVTGRTAHTIWPTQRTDRCKTFRVVKERLYLHHRVRPPQRVMADKSICMALHGAAVHTLGDHDTPFLRMASSIVWYDGLVSFARVHDTRKVMEGPR